MRGRQAAGSSMLDPGNIFAGSVFARIYPGRATGKISRFKLRAKRLSDVVAERSLQSIPACTHERGTVAEYVALQGAQPASSANIQRRRLSWYFSSHGWHFTRNCTTEAVAHVDVRLLGS
jgi:hypothetical protein